MGVRVLCVVIVVFVVFSLVFARVVSFRLDLATICFSLGGIFKLGLVGILGFFRFYFSFYFWFRVLFIVEYEVVGRYYG